MSSERQEQRPWFALWADIVQAVEVRVAKMKLEYAPEAASVGVIPAPARHIVIEDHGKPIVQARISLAGDRIDITNQHETRIGIVIPFPVEIKIELENGTPVYISGDERLRTATDVAEIILNPVLDLYRMANR